MIFEFFFYENSFNRRMRLFFCFFLSCQLWNANAQEKASSMLEAEISAHKKKLPEFKKMKKQEQMLNEMIIKKENYLNQLKDHFDELEEQLFLQTRLSDSMEKQLRSLRKISKKTTNLKIYKIQIGAYQTHPIDIFDTLTPHFTIDNRQANLKRYYIGHFNSYEEAFKFNQLLKRKNSQLKSYVVSFEKS